eukprot:1331854-Rhodomonas_salina.2
MLSRAAEVREIRLEKDRKSFVVGDEDKENSVNDVARLQNSRGAFGQAAFVRSQRLNAGVLSPLRDPKQRAVSVSPIPQDCLTPKEQRLSVGGCLLNVQGPEAEAESQRSPLSSEEDTCDEAYITRHRPFELAEQNASMRVYAAQSDEESLDSRSILELSSDMQSETSPSGDQNKEEDAHRPFQLDEQSASIRGSVGGFDEESVCSDTNSRLMAELSLGTRVTPAWQEEETRIRRSSLASR